MSDTIITTPAGINFFHALQVTHGLALEINTGMKFSNRGSLIQVAKSSFGVKGGSKHTTLLQMVGVLEELDYTWQASASIQKAMDSK